MEGSPLQRSRRVDEINHMNLRIEESNDRWVQKVRLLEGKYENTIKELEDQNISLLRQLDAANTNQQRE